jgi:hypothetical protein
MTAQFSGLIYSYRNKKGELKLVYGSKLTLTSELVVQHDPMFLSSSSAKSRLVSAINLWGFSERTHDLLALYWIFLTLHTKNKKKICKYAKP